MQTHRTLFTPCFAAALLFSAAATNQATGQNLYSQSVTRSHSMNVRMTLTNAKGNETVQITVTNSPSIGVTAPASFRTDASGYGGFNFVIASRVPTTPVQKITVTLKAASLPNGQLTREYLVKSVNGEIYSAWPEFLQIQGAFCSPVTDAACHLQIDRTIDLDGDGVYGDRIIENNKDKRDWLDFPSEFSMDVNAQGTNACNGGNKPGVFWPFAANRQVAFLADNRKVTNTCTFTTRMNFLQDMAFSPSFGGKPTIFATSSSYDTVLICQDTNGDGSITDPEIKTFFDPTTLVNNENYSPDGVAVDPTNAKRVYWISDKSGATGSKTNQGLFALTDANSNNVIDSGEVKASWTGSSGSVKVESTSIDASEFECVHVDGQGGVLVNQTALGTIFRWVDKNTNGVAETGEVSNWLTYNTGSALTVNADFKSSKLQALPGTYFGMNLIESAIGVGTGGRDVYFVGWAMSQGAGRGNIYRCEDKNGNGTVNDAGEVTLFNDFSKSTDPWPPDFVSGLDVYTVDENGNGSIQDNEIFVYGAFPNGPKPTCGFSFADLNNWRFHDRNGDGDATDPGEAERISIHPTGAYNRGLEVIPGPVDGGFRHTFYSRSTVVTVQSAACTTSKGNYLTLDFLREKVEEGTQGTPFAGNTRFALVTRNNLAAAAIAMSAQELTPSVPFGPCTLGVLPPVFTFAAAPSASGEARFPFAIPAGLDGTVFVQALTLGTGSEFVLGETAEFRIR